MSWIVEQKDVHVTIGSSIRVYESSGRYDEIYDDMRMVKLALLYADEAKLVSLPAFALVDMRTPHDMRKADPIAYLRNISVWQAEGEKKKELIQLIETFERAKRRRHSKRGREELNQLNKWFTTELQRLQEEWAARMSEPGVQELFEAINSGLLEVHAFESIFDRTIQGTFSADEAMIDYVTTVSAAASDAQTYPLFDETTSRIIAEEIEAGKINLTTTGVARNKEVALAGDLLARLPLFERATVKEILDIRRELEKPLRHFRSAMIKFSSQIESAPWDKDFAQDADQVFRSEVAPAVLELEEEGKSNSFLSRLTAKVAEKSIQVGGAVSASAAISALAVRMLNLPLADVAALAVGPAIVAGGVAYSAYREWRERQKITEGNSLFFYYKAGSLLDDRIYEYVDTKQL